MSQASSCTLAQAIQCAHDTSLQGWPIEILVEPGSYQVQLAIGMDVTQSPSAAVTVSALRIFATQPGVWIEPASPTNPILTIHSGNAPITLEGIGLRGAIEINAVASPSNVEHSIINCVFNGSAAAVRPAGGGLIARAGNVNVTYSTFNDMRAVAGGALALIANVNASGADVIVSNTNFYRNRATQGGAVYVEGGRLTVRASLMEENEATQEGGALFVSSGEAIVGAGAKLSGNNATRGSTFFLSYGTEADLLYNLPAPLAHWVPETFQCIRYQAPCPASNPSCDAPELPEDQQPWDQLKFPELRDQYVAVMARGPSNDDFPFACAPGKWSDSTDVRAQSRAACSGPCPTGFFCGAATHSPLPCPRGSYCPTGSAVATLCDAGTYQDLPGRSACKECPVGHACVTGATVQVQCVAGSYANAPSRAAACELCGAGTFQDASHQTTCNTCPAGSACTVGAVSASACEPGTIAASPRSSVCVACVLGTYQSQAGSTACIYCPAGSSCPVRSIGAPVLSIPRPQRRLLLCLACSHSQTGVSSLASAVPTACSPGAYTSTTAQGSCTAGTAGTYQSSSGRTGCITCPNAHFCVEGSTAPTACPAGTFRPTTGGASVSGCGTCPAGSACVSGASAHVLCSAGSYSLAGAATCTLAPDGYYQDVAGSTGVKICRAGFFCPEGSSIPVPCPGGTFGSFEGFASEDQCRGVAENTWAPLGSRNPELCPRTGFWCPGQQFDVVNAVPGSRPILFSSGGTLGNETVVVEEP